MHAKSDIRVRLLGRLYGPNLHALNDGNVVQCVGIPKHEKIARHGSTVRATGSLYFVGRSKYPRLQVHSLEYATQ